LIAHKRQKKDTAETRKAPGMNYFQLTHQTPNKGRAPQPHKRAHKGAGGEKQDLSRQVREKQGWDLCMHVELEKEMERAERQSRQTHKGGRLPDVFRFVSFGVLSTRKGKNAMHRISIAAPFPFTSFFRWGPRPSPASR
jgi:hypothetical protein